MALSTRKNQDDSKNPGIADYEKKFGFNPYAGNERFDQKTKNTFGPQDVKDAEANPKADWKNGVQGKVAGAVAKRFGVKVGKKGSPIAIIVALILLGVVLLSLVTSSSLLLVQVGTSLTEFLDNSSPALKVRTVSAFKNKVANSLNFSSDGVCSIRCKFGSMTNSVKESMETKGFKVEGEKNSLNRWKVSSIEFPNGGGIAKTGDEFKALLKNVANLSYFKKAFNYDSRFFLSKTFNKALRRLNLSKASTIKGDTESELEASTKEALDIEEDTSNLDTTEKLSSNQTTAKLGDTLSSATAKLKGADSGIGAVGAMCDGYDIAQNTTYAVKTLRYAKLAAFAMVFLVAYSQLKAGDLSDTTMTALGDQLTAKDEDGVSIMDSAAYRQANYGDKVTIPEKYQKYTLGLSSGLTVFLASLTSYLTSAGTTALTAARYMCGVAGSTITDIATTCPEEIALAISTGGSAAAFSAGVCVVKLIVGSAIISNVLSVALGKIISSVASSDLPTLTSNTIGQAGGTSMYGGTAVVLNSKSAGFGLSAGNTEEVKQYALDTSGTREQEEQLAYYEARETPFDITNKYSFLGSIVSSLNLASIANSGSFSSILSGILSIFPKSIASINNSWNSAGADAVDKAVIYAEGNCTDASLTSVGVNGDSFCTASYVMSSTELNMDTNTALDYMISKNQIDETTGDVVSGSDYDKYMTYCANRTDPLGTTSESITSSDYAWAIGLNCTNPDSSTITEELTYFHVYTMDKGIEDTFDEEL